MCGAGRLSLKLGRYGAFIGCSNYPECRFTRRLGVKPDEEPEGELKERLIGVDPDSREEVLLRRGPYGPYVQRGQGETLKRSSLPPGLDPADLDLATALALLALPREVGRHPETGQPIEAGINRYGPYVKHDRFVRLGPEDDVLTLGMNRAMALLAEAGTRQRAAAKQLKDLGAHPKDRKPVTLHQGRYGPYVRHGKDNASLRKAQDPEQLTLEQAVELLAERAGKSKAKGRTAKAKGAPTSASAAKSPARAAGKGAGKAGKGAAKGATRRVTST